MRNDVSVKKNLQTINENIYENLPPLPPRIPFINNEELPPPRLPYINNEELPNHIDRQFGSETDSGIDINETAGRVFALSLDDKKLEEIPEIYVTRNTDTYTTPVGLFYNGENNKTIARKYNDDNETLPCGFFIRPANGINPKYQSWNGRSLQQSERQEFNPYSSRRRPHSMVYEDTYEHKNIVSKSFKPYEENRDRSYSDGNRERSIIYDENRDRSSSYEESREPPFNSGREPPSNSGSMMADYNFDHQPEIML